MMKYSISKLEKLIKTARELFFHYGIRRLSIDEICLKAQVSKTTFYRHFKNKDALVICILDEIYTEIWNKIDQVMASKIIYDEKIKQLVTLKIEMINDYSREFTNDIMLNEDSESGKYIMRKRNELYEQTQKIYTDAQDRGKIRPDIKYKLVLYLIEEFREIINNEDLQNLYLDPSQLKKEVVELFSYGIKGR